MKQTTEDVRFIHRKLGPGHVTIAYRIEGEAIISARAYCSPRDQFSRKIGRAISSGRLNYLKCPRFVDFNRNYNNAEIVDLLLKNLAKDRQQNRNLPSWAQTGWVYGGVSLKQFAMQAAKIDEPKLQALVNDWLERARHEGD